MDRKRIVVFFIVGMALMSLMLGCAPNRPKIRTQSVVTISDLKENWQNYYIYYAGSSYRPIGILFDPKNNDFKLQGDRWTRVEDEATLSRLVEAIDPNMSPRSIVGRSNNQLYGFYLPTRFTTTPQYIGGHTYNPTAKEIDETTVRVDMVRQNFPQRDY